jgi:hypothetical protein
LGVVFYLIYDFFVFKIYILEDLIKSFIWRIALRSARRKEISFWLLFRQKSIAYLLLFYFLNYFATFYVFYPLVFSFLFFRLGFHPLSDSFFFRVGRDK